jgi:excisionase family DNA binding protein
MRADPLPLSSSSPQLLTVADAARRLALSIRSVRTQIALGKLPVVRVSARAVRVMEADLAAFVAARRVAT